MNVKGREIIERIQSGDEVAFNAMYDAFYERLLNYALRRTLDQQVAEDICANVFIKIVQKIGKFEWRHENSLSGWIFRIAGGEVADYFRKLDRYHFAPPEDIELMMSSSGVKNESYKQVEKEIDQSRDFIVLQKAIRQLKPQYQEIIHLYFFEKMKHADIAETMKMNESTVRVGLHRALKQLRKLLGTDIDKLEIVGGKV